MQEDDGPAWRCSIRLGSLAPLTPPRSYFCVRGRRNSHSLSESKTSGGTLLVRQRCCWGGRPGLGTLCSVAGWEEDNRFSDDILCHVGVSGIFGVTFSRRRRVQQTKQRQQHPMLVPELSAPQKVLLADVDVLTFTRGHLTTR